MGVTVLIQARRVMAVSVFSSFLPQSHASPNEIFPTLSSIFSPNELAVTSATYVHHSPTSTRRALPSFSRLNPFATGGPDLYELVGDIVWPREPYMRRGKSGTKDLQSFLNRFWAMGIGQRPHTICIYSRVAVEKGTKKAPLRPSPTGFLAAFIDALSPFADSHSLYCSHPVAPAVAGRILSRIRALELGNYYGVPSP